MNVKNIVDGLCSWSPSDRPSFKEVVHLLQSDGSDKVQSLVDKMISRLEKHTQNLESLVEAR